MKKKLLECCVRYSTLGILFFIVLFCAMPVYASVANFGGLVPCNGTGTNTYTPEQIAAFKADIVRLQQKEASDSATFNANNFARFNITYHNQSTYVPATDVSVDASYDSTATKLNFPSGGVYKGAAKTLKDGTVLENGQGLGASTDSPVDGRINSFFPQQASTVLTSALNDEESAIAADNAKINASGGECNLSSLIVLIQNVVNAMFIISIPTATISFMVIGIILLTAQGNPERIVKAKKIAKNVLVGFILILSAWLIVYTITHALLDSQFNTFMKSF